VTVFSEGDRVLSLCLARIFFKQAALYIYGKRANLL